MPSLMAARRSARTWGQRNMSILPSTTIDVLGNQITVDADAIAEGLGLTVEVLQKEMAEGRVLAVTETGIADDDGRLRVTFRYGTRIWRIVRFADGTLVDEQVAESETGQAIEHREVGRDAKQTL